MNTTERCEHDVTMRGFVTMMMIITLIKMDICKEPTLRLKALDKNSITHIMYIEMENVTYQQKANT